MHLFWGLLLSGLSLAGQAIASTVHVESALRAVPIALAGTLEPASLSLNGRQLGAQGGTASHLRLNGAPVDAQEGAVFLRTSLDRLELEWELADGTRRAVATLSYPAIESFEISPTRAAIRVNSQTRSLSIDGKELELKDGRAELAHTSEPGWLERAHMLELQAPDGGGRIYNLEPTFREDVLSDRKVALGSINSPGGSGEGLALWLQRVWPDRKALSAGLAYSTHSQQNDTNGSTSTQSDVVLMVRAGYRPFEAGDSWFDLRRLEAGLLGELFHDSTSFSGTGFDPSTRSKVYGALGFYLHLEPFRFGPIGLGFYLSPLPFRALRPFDYASMGNGVELGYHW